MRLLFVDHCQLPHWTRRCRLTSASHLAAICGRSDGGRKQESPSPSLAPSPCCSLTSVTHEPLRSRQDDWRRGCIETDNCGRRRRRCFFFFFLKKEEPERGSRTRKNGSRRTTRLFFTEKKTNKQKKPLTANDRGPSVGLSV